LLFQRKTIKAQKELEEKVKADGIAAALQLMDCRAVGIGAHDLAGGLNFLQELRKRHNTTWLSMNLVDPEKKKPIFTPHLITEIGGLKIALLGLTDDQGEHNEVGQNKDYIILPWQDLLPKALAEVKKKVDMTILLSSYSYQVNKEIAETVDGLHMILESGHAAPTADPYTVENTLIAQTGTRGKYLGMMQIEWNQAGKWSEQSFMRIRTQEDRLKRIQGQLARLERQKNKKALSKDKEYKMLSIEAKQLAVSIKALKKSRDSSPEDNDMCKYTNQFIPLATSLPEDPEVKKIIDQTIQKANEINKQRITQAGKPIITLQDIAGSQKCQQCHADQMNIWQESGHAQAWTTLEKKNQQFNEDCLICHVTLPVYDPDKVKAGNLLLMMPKSLKNVGCEACHGPGAAHSAGQGKIPVARPDEKVCLQCHTPEHDDNFIFSEKAKKLKCSSAQEPQDVQEASKEPSEKDGNNEKEKGGKKERPQKDEEQQHKGQPASAEPQVTAPEVNKTEKATGSEDTSAELIIQPRKKKTAGKKE
jgi:hypothetical protein